jgi:hypothetical protein
MKLYKPTRIAAAVVMGLCTSLAKADSLDRPSLWVNAGFYTAHFDHYKDLRNANPGLGLEWTLNDTYSITAGGFKNSDNQHSDYVGMYVLPWRWQNFKAGAVVGAFDGYPRANQGGWFPALIPVVSWEGAQWGINTAIIPTVKDKLYGGISFQMKYKLTH